MFVVGVTWHECDFLQHAGTGLFIQHICALAWHAALPPLGHQLHLQSHQSLLCLMPLGCCSFQPLHGKLRHVRLRRSWRVDVSSTTCPCGPRFCN